MRSGERQRGFSYLLLLLLLAVLAVAATGSLALGHAMERRAAEEALLAVGEEALPGALAIDSGLEKVFEPATTELGGREPEQSAGGRIDVDECPRIVDDHHGVTGGGEERLGLYLGEHLT